MHNDTASKIFREAAQTINKRSFKLITRKTLSKTDFGTCNQEELFTRTGNNAPNVEHPEMIKIDATRKPKKVSAPPPEPQLSASSSSLVVSMCIEADVFGRKMT